MAFSDFFKAGGLPTPFLDIVRAGAARKANSLERQDFYHDLQADKTLEILNQRFANKKQYGWSIPSVNLVRKIVNKRSAVYTKAPKRTFEGWDQAKGEALYTAINADVLMKKAARPTKLHKTTALQVRWADGPRACVLTPNILDALGGDPERPGRIIVTHPGVDRKGKKDKAFDTYSDWTATTFAKRDNAGREFRVEGNPTGVNPYGRIPMVPLFDYSPDADFFLAGGDDLVEAQKAVNVTLANLLKNLESQSHGYPWIASGQTGAKLYPQGSLEIVSPTRALMLPEGGKFGFAKPEMPVDEVLKAVEFLLKEVAVANDLPPSTFSVEPQPESGRAKLIESSALIEAREDDVGLWRAYERQLFELLKTIINTHEPGTIPDAATLAVDFGEILPVTTESERLTAHQQKIDMGIWSPVDALMASNPDVTDRAEAVALLQERREESSVLGTLFSGPPIATGET